jgi:HAUS augmin-like complex subunit 3
VGQFIGFLVDQLARHRFLQVASHLERKTTSSAYELLRLVEADLQAYTQITSGRIVCFLAFSSWNYAPYITLFNDEVC